MKKSREALLFEARQIEQIMLRKVYPVGSIDPIRVAAIAESFIESGHVSSLAARPLDALLYQNSSDTLTLTLEEQDYLREKSYNFV